MGYLKGKNALQMQNTHFIPVDRMEKEKYNLIVLQT